MFELNKQHPLDDQLLLLLSARARLDLRDGGQQPEDPFEEGKQQLGEMLDVIRQMGPEDPNYFSLVDQYNEALDRLVDEGLDKPLEDELLLGEHLLSDKYLEFEKQWERERPHTIAQFIKKSSFICMVEVSQVDSHTAQARVIRQYKGTLPSYVIIRFYIPWGLNEWYKNGERAIVFLDDELIGLGLPGRMPVVERDGVEYALSYHGDPDFWPDDAELRQEVLDGERVLLIKLDHVEKIIKGKSVLAILPFETINAEQGEGELQLDMADSINRNLVEHADIIVRPMSSVMSLYASLSDPVRIGREMEADFVLGGDVLRRGERISATVQLTSARDEIQLWKGKYEGHFHDVFAIENSISDKIVQILNPHLPNEEGRRPTKIHTPNQGAYQKYKLGRFYLNQFTKKSLDAAIEYFSQAKELDPTFAEARSGIADCYIAKGIYNIAPPEESFEKALEHAEEALRIDDTLAAAHTSLAYIYMCNKWDWPAAEQSYIRALELNPNYALAHQGYAHLLGGLGRFSEALKEIERALEIDPTSPIINVVRGFILYYAGRYEESRQQFLHTIKVNRRFDATYYGLALTCEQLALAYMKKGDLEGAMAMFYDAKKAAHKAVVYSGKSSHKEALEAHVHALSGNLDKAQQILSKLNARRKQEYVSPFHIASVYAAMATTYVALGNHAQALECCGEVLKHLDVSLTGRDQWLMLLNVEPRFTIVREHEQFKDLIRKLDFPPDIKISDSTKGG